MPVMRVTLASAGALVLIATLIAVLAAVAPGTSSQPAATASVSAAGATRFVSPAGSDAGSCRRRTPCRSLDRAYRVAAPGERVSIAAGTYPSQRIGYHPAKQSARSPVVLEPAPRAVVTIDGDLTVTGSNVVVRARRGSALRLDTLWSRTTGRNDTRGQRFENLDGATFQIWGTSDVTIAGGDWGPGSEPDDPENRIAPDGGVRNSRPRRIVLDGVRIHDQSSSDLTRDHNGGLLLVAGSGIVIRDSLFERNAVYDIEVQDFTTAACCGMKYGNATDVTLSGNRFRRSVLAPPYGARTQDAGQPEVQLDPVGGAWEGWTIRRNSFDNGLATAFDGPGSSYDRFVVAGNLGGRLTDCGGAGRGARWTGNVWARSPCSPGDARVPFGYALAGGRLRATADAAAVREAFALVAAGRAAPDAARELRRRGRRGPGGAWTAERVRDVVADRAYLGGRLGAPGAHPRIVGAALWRAAARG